MKGGFVHQAATAEEEQFSLRRLERRSLRRLLLYLRPHWPSLLAALAGMLMVTTSTVVQPLLVQQALDYYILPGETQGLANLILLYLALLGLGWLGAYWQSLLSGQVGQKVVAQLREDLFRHLQGLSLDFFQRESTGGVMARLTHDVNKLAQLVSEGLVNMFNDFLTMGAMVVVMLLLAPDLAVVAFVTIPLILLSSVFFGRRMRRAYHRVQEKLATMNTQLQENLSGIRLVQSLTREKASEQSFRQINRESLRANLHATVLFALYFPAVTVTGSLGTALVLWYGGLQVVAGEVSLGVVVAFITYIRRFFNPLRELSQIYNLYQSAGAALDRISRYLDQQPSVQETRAPLSPGRASPGTIACQGVSFGYSQGPWVLRQLDLNLEPGATLGLVGASGSGKTTLARLLLRLYDPQEGNILWDGVDIRRLGVAEWRRIITMVPQEPFLFAASLEENLRVANPEASREDLNAALETSGLGAVLSSASLDLDTVVGPRGVTLSGGQRQLVGLARAFLRQPRAVVLDEPTSSIDALTEAWLQEGMRRLLQGRSGLVIAHRPQTLKLADRIALLDNGRVSAEGNWAQLWNYHQGFRQLLALNGSGSAAP